MNIPTTLFFETDNPLLAAIRPQYNYFMHNNFSSSFKNRFFHIIIPSMCIVGIIYNSKKLIDWDSDFLNTTFNVLRLLVFTAILFKTQLR